MKKSVEQAIESYLEGFLQGLLNKYDPNIVGEETLKKKIFSPERGEYKPFHEALIPSELLRIQRFFRSFSTSLGQGVFEYIAKLIAESSSKWADVRTNHPFGVLATPEIQSHVDTFVEKIQARQVKPYPYPKFPKPKSKSKETKEIVVDLSFKDARSGQRYFIEIKSPKPNKDQTKQTKIKFAFLKASYPGSETYFALPYNPYGERKSNYKWSFTKMFFDLDHEVMIGREFWDFLGGRGTYKKILEIFERVGRTKGKAITKRLIGEQ